MAEVIASTHEQQRDEADLAAQRDMAKYALAMVIVSGFGTVVGVAGLIFIANTLEATREGNAISQDTARRQLRAYLQAELIAGQPVVSNKRIYMTARVKNVGQTPAYFVTSIAQIMTSKRPPSPDNEREIEAALATIPDVENELTLGSSVETHVIKEITAQNEEFADAFGEEVKSAIEGGGHCLVFVGRISYVDIFDQRHVTKFAHVFERRNDQWAATYHERGNHAD